MDQLWNLTLAILVPTIGTQAQVTGYTTETQYSGNQLSSKLGTFLEKYYRLKEIKYSFYYTVIVDYKVGSGLNY